MSSSTHGPSDMSKNSSVVSSTDSYKRRESLVKPTWQNICPGQVSADTMEKLKKMGNSCDTGTNEHTIAQGTTSNNTNGSQTTTDRPEVGFDIFGKVK